MIRKINVILLITLLLSSFAMADEYTNAIDSAVKRFSTSDYKQLKLAMQELANMPVEANDELIARFKKAKIAEKIVLIEVFALREQTSACSDIIDMIEFLPESAASRIATALDKIGDIGWKTLIKRIEERSKKGLARSPKLEKIYTLLVRERILNFYQERVNSRRFAYYMTEYTDIFKFGKITLDVLSDLIFNNDNILGNFPADQTDKIREYAVRSLGDSGISESKAIIERALSVFSGYSYSYWGWGYNDAPSVIDFSTVCELSLYNLGDTERATKLINLAKVSGKKFREIQLVEYKYYLANMYLIIHKYDEAEKIFNEVIKSLEAKEDNSYLRKKAYALYKMAVISGIRAASETDKEKKASLRRKCMQSLKAAYRAGFNDFARIFLDKNIQILWETGEFKKWINRLRKDEKVKDLIPTWEPGKPTKLTNEEREKAPESESFAPFPE